MHRIAVKHREGGCEFSPETVFPRVFFSEKILRAKGSDFATDSKYR